MAATDLSQMTRWSRRGVHAPHKPLLVLMALGSAIRGEDRLMSFASVEEPLRQLIKDFGPLRQQVHPEYPFWRLQMDGFWEVRDAKSFGSRKSNTDPPISQLRERDAQAGFLPEIYAALSSNRLLASDCAGTLAVRFFPGRETDVLNATKVER